MSFQSLQISHPYLAFTPLGKQADQSECQLKVAWWNEKKHYKRRARLTSPKRVTAWESDFITTGNYPNQKGVL
jgi:hypothetical protein